MLRSLDKKLKYVVAQLGARMHYAVPEIMHADKRLVVFYTDNYNKFSFLTRLEKVLPNWMNWKKLLTRASDHLPQHKVNSFFFFGISYLLKIKKCRSLSCVYEIYAWAGEKFNKLIQRDIYGATDTYHAVYSFNTASLSLFKALKGKKALILEQCIAPYAVERNLLDNEGRKHPLWQNFDSTHPAFTNYINIEQEELDLADYIFCPSVFVKESVLSINAGWENKIKIIPYGVGALNLVSKQFTTSGPLKIVTVGKAGLRKGTPYILEAAKQLKGIATFRMVGDLSEVPSEIISTLHEFIELKGQVNRDEMKSHYEWADIFLLPSVCEGSATVTYEAMQFGLPLIVTPNTGSIIRDGIDGYLIRAASAEDIVEKILVLYHDRTLLEQFSKRVFEQSRQGSLQAYSERLRSALSEIDMTWKP